MSKVGFRTAKKIGRDFVEPVSLSHEHGFTYGQGLQTLGDIITSTEEDAKIRGNSLTLRTAFAYDAAAAMAEGGKAAFITGTKFKFERMMESATYRLEAQMLYGNAGLGTFDDTATASIANTTEVTMAITAASWAPGLWAGSENAQVAIFDAAGVAIAGVTTNKYTVLSVDTDAKTITLDAASGGDATATKAALEASAHTVFFYGAKGNEMVGLRSIVANTGTLYGVNGASYSLWQGNTHAVGGALSLKKIYQGVNRAVGKGLMEKVSTLVSPATFAILANDEASLRRYNAVSGKAETGFENITYYGPNGIIEVLVHPMMKEGEGFVAPLEKAERIGATDITFNTPGKDGEMFQQLHDQTGYECRLYSEQALWLPCPSKCVLLSGITNA